MIFLQFLFLLQFENKIETPDDAACALKAGKGVFIYVLQSVEISNFIQ